MVLEALQKYSMILRLTKSADLSVELLNTVLPLFKLDLSDPVKGYLVNTVNALSAEKGYKNLLEVAKDEEFTNILIDLKNLSDQQGSGEPSPGFTKSSNGSISIDVESIVKCPHCRKPFSLLDAPGLAEKVGYNVQK